MSALTAHAVDLPRFSRRRELLLGAVVTAAFAGLILALGPAPGDAAVHLYRTFLVQHGALVWDNFWYSGTYPLASYSLLYYLPAALVGNLPLVFAAAVASTLLFSSIALREWGSAALWPSRVFGVLAAAPMFTGLYAYSLGFTAMLATLKLLQLRRFKLAIVGAALTVGFSPLAFAFLCLVVVSYAVAQRRFSRRHLWFGAGLAAAAAVELAALLIFPTNQGVYPFHWIDFVGVLVVTALGVLVARHARGAATLSAFFALWGLGSVLVYIVPSPLGDNWTRLGAFVFPVMLLTASLAGFRPRRLVLFALAGALAYNLVPYFLLIPSRLDTKPQQASFWQAPIGYLQTHAQPGYRVEVVPTAEHWEAYWIPKAGFPLARGGYHQLDVVDNPTLYKTGPLTATAYRQWLRKTAVRYVILTRTAPLDWAGGPKEAQLLKSGASGLKLVFQTTNWSIYELPHATPLLTGPASPLVTAFGHTTIRGRVFAPGRYLLRARYTPYWRLKGAGCVARGPDKMTVLDLTKPGAFTLAVPGTPQSWVKEVVDGKRATCKTQ